MYLPLDQDQPDSISCVPTTASMIVDGSTAGVKRPSVRALRAAVGDYSGGMSYVQMEQAAREVSNVQLRARYGLLRSEVWALASSGRDFGISIDLATTWPTARRTGFASRGGHTVLVPKGAASVWPGGMACFCERRSSLRHSEVTVQDPGTWSVGYQQWSADLLFRAAENRTGHSGINVLVGLDTTDVWRKGTGQGYVRAAPSTKSKALRRVEARAYHVMEMVRGERWRRHDGTYSYAWYRIEAGGYIRGDRIIPSNVVKA